MKNAVNGRGDKSARQGSDGVGVGHNRAGFAPIARRFGKDVG